MQVANDVLLFIVDFTNVTWELMGSWKGSEIWCIQMQFTNEFVERKDSTWADPIAHRTPNGSMRH